MLQSGQSPIPKEYTATRLLNTKEAAVFLGTTESTLRHWRCVKRYNLPVVKIGRLVKYRLSDLEQFIKDGIQ